MKIIQILNARDSLAKVNKIKFNDFNITIRVFKLTKRVNEILEIVQMEQKRIIEEYVLTDEKGNPVIENSRYKFKNVSDAKQYEEEYAAMLNTEAEDLEQIQIPLASVKSATDISSEDLIKLVSLIEWVE